MVVGKNFKNMEARENRLSIIEDNKLDKLKEISAQKTKNGYKLKYRKNSSFLHSGGVDDGTIVVFMFMTLLVGGLTLLFVSSFKSILVWCITPFLSFVYIVCCFIYGNKLTKEDLVLACYCFLLTVSINWACLSAGYNGNFYTKSIRGKAMYEYVKENVDPKFIFIKER